MSGAAFDQIEQVLRDGGSEAGFDFLVEKFREEKNYRLLFETRLLRKRYELGLPLIQIEPLEDLPDPVRRPYEEGFIEAAREAGSLFLAEGDIQRAWPYLRAIGETAAVVEAIDRVEPKEGIDPIIEIAFFDRAHPRKGFELILANYGVCRAITSFQQLPSREGREDCLRLLIRRLHHDLAASLKRTIAQAEGQAPDTESVPELIAGRDWLFEGYNYYIDTSHVASVMQFSLDSKDPEILARALELTEYATHLSSMFQYRGEPPFDSYVDYAIYLRALLGKDVDQAIAHFRSKAAENEASQGGSGPAQALLGLLVRLGRYSEAIEVSLEYLSKYDASQLSCPSVIQLCQMARDHEQLMRFSRQQGDLLSFTAAVLLTESRSHVGAPVTKNLGELGKLSDQA